MYIKSVLVPTDMLWLGKLL